MESNSFASNAFFILRVNINSLQEKFYGLQFPKQEL
jgi:hypothetical protein